MIQEQGGVKSGKNTQYKVCSLVIFEVSRGCDFVAPLVAVSPEAVSPEDVSNTCVKTNWIQANVFARIDLLYIITAC